MGRDQMRVLLCAVASLALLLAATLMLSWYQLVPSPGVSATGSVAVDLHHIHICTAVHRCSNAPLSLLPGMFPTMAAVTLWSSLGIAALIAFQAGSRMLTGTAIEAFSRVGYLFALMTISTVIAAVYMFGPETEEGLGVISELGGSLGRTWAPLTSIVGLILGLATLYLAVAPESADYGAGYKPITLPQPGDLDLPSLPEPVEAEPGALAADLPPGEPSVVVEQSLAELSVVVERTPIVQLTRPPRAPTDQGLGASRTVTGQLPPSRPSPRPSTQSGLGASRTATGQFASGSSDISVGRTRTATGQFTAVDPAIAVGRTRTATGQQLPPSRPSPRPSTQPGLGTGRTATGQFAAVDPAIAVGRTRTATGQFAAVGPELAVGRTRTATGPLGQGRARTGSLPPVPEHLRRRLAYVAITAELTGGGLDAHHEDGSSRLVLWRDVVGVVARRMPAAYDYTAFVDIVSTAGSTLRIVSWTRLTGEPIAGDGDERTRALVERVTAICPDAKLDPATRQFLETGELAQIPDLETLQAHDARLA